MFEKVNPSHPDKVADRIGGAIVDLAYAKEENPRVAVEVMIGHGICHTMVETSAPILPSEIDAIVERIAGKDVKSNPLVVPQDVHLAANQRDKIRCGDNGIFKGVPVTDEQWKLVKIARDIYEKHPTDGKYILDGDKLIICQSCADTEELKREYLGAIVNPLGDWTGGPNSDSGISGRKLGSDMADSATGGSINAKDCSKADVSVNIYAWLKAQLTNQTVWLSCAIGDEFVDNRPYEEIVDIAKEFINKLGGFEQFSAWGMVCPKSMEEGFIESFREKVLKEKIREKQS